MLQEKVDKGADGDSRQKIVDLSAVETSLKARTHGRPNLPNVLTQYGLEEKDNKVQVQVKSPRLWVGCGTWVRVINSINNKHIKFKIN